MIAAVAASCGQDEPRERRALPDHTPLSKSGEAREERQLTQTELDTLRSFKRRLRVTRDQYWDGRGGVLGNEWLTVWYPAGNLTPTHGMAVVDRVDGARGQARLLFGRVPGEMLTIVCSESMESYGEETGREWWQYSRIEGDKIVLQPVATIALRGLIEIVPAREYYEWTIGKLSGRKAPRWVEEGFASLISGERDVVESYVSEFPGDNHVLSFGDMEKQLAREKDRKSTRLALFNAFRMVARLVDAHGDAALAGWIADLGDGVSRDDAARRRFGKAWNEVVLEARAWSEEELR
jgi:hypothetical protein